MQHSPTHEHYRDMFVFIVNQIVGSELAPPVHVISSLPVLYVPKYSIMYKVTNKLLPEIQILLRVTTDS